jgi:hypothetical protein
MKSFYFDYNFAVEGLVRFVLCKIEISEDLEDYCWKVS